MGWAAAFFALVALLGIAWFDPLVATATAGGAAGSLWSRGTAWLDLLVLKEVSNFLLGALLLVAAAVALAVRATRRRLGWRLLYLALVQSLSTLIADLAKPPLGRLRPFEAAREGGADVWWVGANSFPSGHTAFYAGLFLPLILIFPRYAPLLALPPLFVAISRVVENDHYPGDVAASIALAAGLSAGLAFLLRRGDRPPGTGPA
jgi:membrane-associated phospholipid phosphatase